MQCVSYVYSDFTEVTCAFNSEVSRWSKRTQDEWNPQHSSVYNHRNNWLWRIFALALIQNKVILGSLKRLSKTIRKKRVPKELI